jgi:hypothetical protein
MNLGQIKARAWRRLGNLPTSDPYYADLNVYANDAANFVVTRTIVEDKSKLHLFNELQQRWHVKTIANIGKLAIPETALIIDRVYSYDDGGASEPDQYSTERRQVIEYESEEEYELAARDEDTEEYPQRWIRINDNIHLWPTPRTDSVTWLLYRGVQLNSEMSSDSDEPTLKELWHPAIVDAMVYLLAADRGWTATATETLAALDRKIHQTVRSIGQHNRKREIRLKIKGAPRRH